MAIYYRRKWQENTNISTKPFADMFYIVGGREEQESVRGVCFTFVLSVGEYPNQHGFDMCFGLPRYSIY